jgi:hypothetical protein
MKQVIVTPNNDSEATRKMLERILTGKFDSISVEIGKKAILVRNVCSMVEIKYSDNGKVFKSLPSSITSKPLLPGGEFKFKGIIFKVS